MTRSGLLAAVLVGAQLLSACTSAAEQDDSTRVLLLGDSITQGKAGDWTWRYRLWRRLQEAGGPAVDLVGPDDDLADGSDAYREPDFDRDHAAFWGAPLSPPPYDPGRLGVYRPDVVVVMLGVNDLSWQREAPAEVAPAMRALVEDLRAASPGVDVVVGHVPVLTVPGAGELNALYDQIAQDLDTDEERVVVAATEAGFVADPASADADTYDGLHPDPSGEIKIAEAVAEALSELGLTAQG